MLFWRLLRTQLRDRFSRFFVLSLAIGLTGFITLDGLKRSFQDILAEASRNILTADVSLSARRPLTEEETRLADTTATGAVITETKTLYSMASAENRSSLIEVKAIGEGYPFYGWFQLAEGGKIHGPDKKDLFERPVIWVVQDILYKLQVEPGDVIKLGEQEFVIGDVVVDSTNVSFAGASLAPRAYIGLPFLEGTHLLRKGSVAWHERLYKLSATTDPALLKQNLDQKLVDPAIRVQEHQSSAEGSGRMLLYLNDYLGLAALVAFFLSALGAAYLFRGFLLARQRDMAVLMALGFSPYRTLGLYALFVATLGALAALVATVVAAGLLPVAGMVVRSLSPIPFNPELPLMTVGIAIVTGSCGALLVCLPLLLRIRALSASSLFQEFHVPQFTATRRNMLWYLPAFLAFYGLSIWQSHSIKVGTIFTGALLVSILAGSALGFVLLRTLARWRFTRFFALRAATRQLARNPVPALSAFLALALAALLTNVIPQLQAGLETELMSPAGSELPSFFLFDIQEDQKEEMDAFLAEKGMTFQLVSPMIVARLTEKNGKALEKSSEKTMTREEEQEQRFRNRGVNLSYRQTLSDSERIVAGKPFSGNPPPENPDEPAELSLEQRYAERLGLEVGDVLTFDVQSVPIHGKVVNLRKVRWTTFQPNFFIQFQDGVLDDAPKTFLASLPRLANPEDKHLLQSELVTRFPNVSIIDVSLLVTKILETIQQMGFILAIMTIFSLAAAVTVLFGIARHLASSRAWDMNLMKILGASPRTVLVTAMSEFMLLAAAAALFGAVAGMAVSWVLAREFFDGAWTFNPWIPVGTVAGFLALTGITVLVAISRVTRARPALYLNQR